MNTIYEVCVHAYVAADSAREAEEMAEDRLLAADETALTETVSIRSVHTLGAIQGGDLP